MGIKARFTAKDVKAFIEEKKRRLHQVIIDKLTEVGLRFVINARDLKPEEGGFSDKSGNLRSSIGYIILHDGVAIKRNFQSASKGTDKTTGLERGKEFADEVAKEHGKGFVLVVVAGMDYAAAVESKGKDVITGSSLIAKQMLIDAKAQIKKLAKR